MCYFFFFFKNKTAYDLRISDWSSDVCSSDLTVVVRLQRQVRGRSRPREEEEQVGKVVRMDQRQPPRRGQQHQSPRRHAEQLQALQNGRTSCRESVCKYG